MTDDLIARLLAVDYSAPHNELCRDAAAALSAARQELAAAQQFVRVDLSKPEDYRRLEAERDALRELVACKDLKERIERGSDVDPQGWRVAHDEYYRRKDSAWKVARAALAAQVKP